VDSNTGLTINTKVPYYKEIGADICGTTCPAGQFIDANILYVCQLCSVECKACQDTAKKCLNAASCATNYFYFDTNSSCLSVCPDMYYANTTTGKCTLCNPGCSICTGGSLTACTVCKVDSTTNSLNPQPYFKRIGHNECTAICDADQYEDPSDYLCKYCHPSCSECLDNS
jgi:proprotein convertase subtilisin/kexin type 5